MVTQVNPAPVAAGIATFSKRIVWSTGAAVNNEIQRALLDAFSGFLAPLEERYQLKLIDDYPLFPGGMLVKGLVGAGINATRKAGGEASIKLGRFAWLGLGPAGLVVTGADNLMGRPKEIRSRAPTTRAPRSR